MDHIAGVRGVKKDKEDYDFGQGDGEDGVAST